MPPWVTTLSYLLQLPQLRPFPIPSQLNPFVGQTCAPGIAWGAVATEEGLSRNWGMLEFLLIPEGDRQEWKEGTPNPLSATSLSSTPSFNFHRKGLLSQNHTTKGECEFQRGEGACPLSHSKTAPSYDLNYLTPRPHVHFILAHFSGPQSVKREGGSR